MNRTGIEQEKSILLKKIRILYLVLFLACVVIIVFTAYFLKERGLSKANATTPFLKPPYAAEVENIIKPLRYSGIQMFKEKDIYLTLDFDRMIWVLHNVHSFNDSGELILPEDRYGTCGELAAYTAVKIRPIFKNEYNIQFVRAAQSGYFLSPNASHVVLKITKKTDDNEVYILDPSFHRYGPKHEFEDYLFFEETSSLDFVENKIKDIAQPFNNFIPILIRHDYLVGFTVEARNNKSGQKDFILGLTLTKKYNYAGRFIFALREYNGNEEIVENKKSASEVLSEEEWKILKQKIIDLFERVTDEVYPSADQGGRL